jgi:hypothetical protein
VPTANGSTAKVSPARIAAISSLAPSPAGHVEEAPDVVEDGLHEVAQLARSPRAVPRRSRREVIP